jgi:DNA-binding response OmpR family regulator
MNTVLIIEDEEVLMRGMIDNFEYAGYRVLSASNGESGLAMAIESIPDLVILDIMLPAINGYEVCRRIREREHDMPIIMLTAKDEESDIVLGLNLGADDYVTKPFGIRELLARASAFLRRRNALEKDVILFGECVLDIACRTFTKNGLSVKLTPKEFNLLSLLTSRPGRAYTRDDILRRVWGEHCFVTLRSVDRCVTTLRNKIEKDPQRPQHIHTVREIGYKFLDLGTQ